MPAIDRVITATVTTSGEVLEYHVTNTSDLSSAYTDVEAYLTAYHSLKTMMLAASMDIVSKQNKEKPDATPRI